MKSLRIYYLNNEPPKTNAKKPSVSKRLLTPLLASLLVFCAPAQEQKLPDFSCNPPSYVKVAKEDEGEISRSILAVGESVALLCGATVTIKEIDTKENKIITSISFTTSSVSLDSNSSNYIECTSPSGKSSLSFQLSGKRISTISFINNGETITLSEGESTTTNGGDPLSKEEKISARFIRGFFADNKKLVIHIDVFQQDKSQPIHLFIETDYLNAQSEIGVKISHTSLIAIGFTICKE